MKKLIAIAAMSMALGLTAVAQTPPQPEAAMAKMTEQTERNKANVLEFYDLVFNQHKVQEAVSKHIGKEFLQHNPDVADGSQAFLDTFTPFVEKFPKLHATIKRVAADGDLVWLHLLIQTGEEDRGQAVVDIFRLDENGKIVEHWDVVQPVPEKTVSGRGMF